MVKYIKCSSSRVSRYYMETREKDGRHTLFFDGEPLWITYEPVYGTDFMKTAERMFQLFVEDLQNCHINGKQSSSAIPDVEFCDKLNILNDKEKIIKAISSHLQWVYAYRGFSNMVKYVKADQYTYDALPTVYTNGNEESKVGIQRYGDNQERYYVMYRTIGDDMWKEIMEMYNMPKYYYNKQSAQRAAKRVIGLI